MTEHTIRRYNNGEILSGVQRRRRWTPEENVRIVEETYLPGMSVSLAARRHGSGAGQLFTWRRLMAQGALDCSPPRPKLRMSSFRRDDVRTG